MHLLHSPLKDKNIIIQRQRLMLDLMDNLDFKNATVNRAEIYSFIARLRFLLNGGHGQYSSGDSEGLAAMFFGGNITNEEVAEIIERSTSLIDNSRDQRLSVQEELGCYLSSLGGGVTNLNSFIDLLSSIDNPDAKAMAEDINKTASVLTDLTWQKLVDMIRNEDRDAIAELAETMKSLGDILHRVGAIISFAKYAKENEDKFNSVTFDSDREMGYREGYNLARLLDGQTPNIATGDASCVVLTGPNESGKSYKIMTDLFIQLSAQSFGIATAKDPNLRIYDNIVYIDRADTESSRDLSAFGSEQDRWQKLIRIGDAATIAFIDEGYSTTSPLDQYALFSASIEILINRGVRFEVATHSEDFIQRYLGRDDFSFYHFEIIMPQEEGGEVTLTHELQDGIADSHALDIARNRGLDSSLLESASNYIAGDIAIASESEIESPDLKAIESYTEEERTILMEETRSLIGFFPNKGEIGMVPESFNPEREEMKTVSGKDALSGYQQPFVLLSADDDFSNWGGMRSVEYEGMRNDHLELIQEMLLWGATTDSKELLERQNMFRLLSESEQLDGLRDNIADLSGLMYLFVNGAAECFIRNAESFNIYILEDQAKALAEFYTYDNNADELKAHLSIFTSILDLTLQELRLSRESLGIAEEMELIYKLVDLIDRSKVKEDALNSLYHERDTSIDGKLSIDAIEKEMKEIEREFARLIGAEIIEEKYSRRIEKDGERFRIRDSGAQQIVSKLAAGVYEKIKNSLAPLSIYDVDRNALKDVFSSIQSSAEKVASRGFGMFTKDYTLLIQLIGEIMQDRDPRAEFLSALRSFDSVHLQQWANYFETNLDVFFGKVPNTQTLWERGFVRHKEYQSLTYQLQHLSEMVQDSEYLDAFCKERIDIFSRIGYERNQLDRIEEEIERLQGMPESERLNYWENDLRREQDELNRVRESIEETERKLEIYRNPQDNIEVLTQEIKERLEYKVEHFSFGESREYAFNSSAYKTIANEELFKLYSMFLYATMIRDYGINEVNFTNQATVDIKGGWNMVKAEDEQVSNSITISDGKRVEIVSGSNMSGKTFFEKMVTRILLAAQVTGFAPADSVTMPIFDYIIYSDRVNPRSDLNLSAFANEMEIRKQISTILNQSDVLVFGALDEICSTTSPKYQSALSFAFTEEFLRMGDFVIIASHNHDYIDAFLTSYPSYTQVGNLRNHLQDGEVVFEYLYQDGHQESNAIEVARTMGFDEEILQLAQEIKIELEQEENEGQSGD